MHGCKNWMYPYILIITQANSGKILSQISLCAMALIVDPFPSCLTFVKVSIHLALICLLGAWIPPNQLSLSLGPIVLKLAILDYKYNKFLCCGILLILSILRLRFEWLSNFWACIWKQLNVILKLDLLVIAFYFDAVVSAKSDCRSASRDRIVVLPRSRRRLED